MCAPDRKALIRVCSRYLTLFGRHRRSLDVGHQLELPCSQLGAGQRRRHQCLVVVAVDVGREGSRGLNHKYHEAELQRIDVGCESDGAFQCTLLFLLTSRLGRRFPMRTITTPLIDFYSPSCRWSLYSARLQDATLIDLIDFQPTLALTLISRRLVLVPRDSYAGPSH